MHLQADLLVMMMSSGTWGWFWRLVTLDLFPETYSPSMTPTVQHHQSYQNIIRIIFVGGFNSRRSLLHVLSETWFLVLDANAKLLVLKVARWIMQTLRSARKAFFDWSQQQVSGDPILGQFANLGQIWRLLFIPAFSPQRWQTLSVRQYLIRIRIMYWNFYMDRFTLSVEKNFVDTDLIVEEPFKKAKESKESLSFSFIYFHLFQNLFCLGNNKKLALWLDWPSFALVRVNKSFRVFVLLNSFW